MQWIKQIKQLVQDGIYIKNLNLIVVAASKGLAAGNNFILPAFIIREVADSVVSLWEGQVVRLSEQSIVEEGLRPAFNALLDAMLRNAPKSEVIASAEALIVAWQSIQTELRDLADLSDE